MVRAYKRVRFLLNLKREEERKKSLLSQRAVADFYLACDKQQSVVRVEKKDRKKSVSVSRTKRTRGKRGILRAVAILLPITTQTYDIMHTHAGTHIHRAASVHHPYENKLFHINHINPLLFLS